MNRIEYLLNKIAEESSNLSKVAMKAQAFGLDHTFDINPQSNSINLQDSFTKVLGAISMLNVELNEEMLFDRLTLEEVEEQFEYWYNQHLLLKGEIDG